MRKPILAANWKMHKTLQEARSFMEALKPQVPGAEKVDTVVCSPALFLPHLMEDAKGSDIKIGAQTMHFENQGAFTGEISPVQLEDLGVHYCIIGHSERREMFNETDETVNKKVLAAFSHHLIPIVCVGESLSERESNQTKEKVEAQIEKGLSGLTADQAKQVVIAYEPIWAIGTGKSSTVEDANIVCGQIRHKIEEMFGTDAAQAVRIQYGGSVKPENVAQFLSEEHIDGALIGGASLDVDSFVKILGAI